MEPSRLARKLAARLFSDSGEAEFWLAAVTRGRRFAPCLAWLEREPPDWAAAGMAPCEDGLSPSWSGDFVHRLSADSEPGKHPWHEEGRYYCLDFSSVFAASPLLGLGRAPQRALDLCAAPGGKTILAWLSSRPEFLLANEVIGKRLGILRHNLARCRVPVYTQRLNPADLAVLAPGGFDLVLVDAPCSGQSLLVRGTENLGCFHPATIQLNARRQRRILAEAVKVLAPGGFLLYSTCTFSLEENERIVEWLCRVEPRLVPQSLPHLEAWRSPHGAWPCYRMNPHQGLGAGAFVAFFQKEGDPGELPALPEVLRQFPVIPRPVAQEPGGLPPH